MALNEILFDGDEDNDPFQRLERDDDPIVWEANELLRREQLRQVERRHDELERERIADFAEADDVLLGLLQEYRYSDKGFMERLDPELARVLGVDDCDVDPEDFEEDTPTHPFDKDETENEDEEDVETDEVPGPNTNSSTLEFKVDVLERLAALRRSGDLTESEFESLKVELFRDQE